LIDFEKIKKLYKIGSTLVFEDVQALFQRAHLKKIDLGECFIEEGSTKKDVYFIVNGLVRSFKRNSNGEEVTISLWWENHVILGYDMIFFNQPTQFYFEALEKTEALVLDYDIIDDIFSKDSKLEEHRKFVLHEILRQFILRLDSFVLLSPKERYLEFVKSNSDIINRVSDKHIANIIGITPVSLSRIRKRISVEKT